MNVYKISGLCPKRPAHMLALLLLLYVQLPPPPPSRPKFTFLLSLLSLSGKRITDSWSLMAGEKNKAKSGGYDNKKRKHRYLPHNVCSSSHLAACSFFPLQKLCFFQVLIWSEISKFYESYQSVRFFITTLRDWSN